MEEVSIVDMHDCCYISFNLLLIRVLSQNILLGFLDGTKIINYIKKKNSRWNSVQDCQKLSQDTASIYVHTPLLQNQ